MARARNTEAAEAAPEPVFEFPVYTVAEDIEVSFADRDGSELRYKFPAGTARPDTEDEWFVLEHVLVPQGSAERLKKGSNQQ